MDDTNSRCGITDRLKAAVGLCYVARLHGLGFRLIHQAGFDLRDYLAPNRIDWSAELSDITDDPAKIQEIRYVAPYADFPEFREGVQYVCKRYRGNNIIEKRGIPDWRRIWRELFFDMFSPTEAVLRELEDCEMPSRYTAVVARFVNSLGHTEDTEYNSPLHPELQEKLIGAVLEKVVECEGRSDGPVVVYSDSAGFLKAAAASGYLTTDVKGIGNIMNGNTGEYIRLRTFVNMLQISKADQVFSILNIDGFPENSLYKTQYPRYAAIIGDRPFYRL